MKFYSVFNPSRFKSSLQDVAEASGIADKAQHLPSPRLPRPQRLLKDVWANPARYFRFIGRERRIPQIQPGMKERLVPYWQSRDLEGDQGELCGRKREAWL
jgi:hypothetical protein